MSLTQRWLPPQLAPLYLEIQSLVESFARTEGRRLKYQAAALESDAAHLVLPAMHQSKEM